MADERGSDVETGSGSAAGADGAAATGVADANGRVATVPAPTKVAIACQGGGSHTAFTAGVLRRLLREWDDDRYRLVGISGSSGGAFNALATWYGLVTGDESTAVELLEALWDDLRAEAPYDRVVNDATVLGSRVKNSGFPTPAVSPYFLPGAWYGQNRIKRVLERHIDFAAVPDLCTRTAPELVVGTVDVNGGVFETFTNERVTAEAVLASAAVPDLFRGVRIDGHLHWDGLFSQNPPVNDLLNVAAARKPEELWVIQVNPQEREGEPRTLDGIADRRNELSGNISLNQELRFVEQVNEWIDAGHLPPDQFSKVTVRRIGIGRRYNYATKLDRSPSFVDELTALGDERAREFLAALAAEAADPDTDDGDGPQGPAHRTGVTVHDGGRHGDGGDDAADDGDA